MSHDRKGLDGHDGAEPIEGDKATMPPPAEYDDIDPPEERTVIGNVDDLIAESARQPAPRAAPPPPPGKPLPPAASSSPGGLRQMFSRDPGQVRAALPSPDEGDALLDMLFDDKDEPAAPPAPDPKPRTAAAPAVSAAAPAVPAAAPAVSAAAPAVSAAAPAVPAAAPAVPAAPEAPPVPRRDAAPAVAPPPPLASRGLPPRPQAPRPVGSPPRPAPPLPLPRVDALSEPRVEALSEPRMQMTSLDVVDDDLGDDGPLVDPAAAIGPGAAASVSDAGGSAPATSAQRENVRAATPLAARSLPRREGAALPVTSRGLPDLVAMDEADAYADPDFRMQDTQEMLAAAPSRPVAIPSRPPPLTPLRDERDASAYLLEQNARDGWAERAGWLRAEAQATQDPARRARTLLAVSELLVMAGEDPKARAVAAEVKDLVPSSPLAHRQLRGLLARDGDEQAALEVLDAETRLAPSSAARCHGAWLGAEIARLRLADAEGAKKRRDQCTRASASDPRAPVQRFAQALADADSGELAKLRAGHAESTEDSPSLLARAFDEVAARRGDFAATAGPPHADASPYESLLRARAALARGDVADGTAHLGALLDADRFADVASGTAWLCAALAAPHRATRARAVETLRIVTAGSHGSAARRAIAARAIELGDAEAARSATDTADSGAFSAADRVALAALTGGTLEDTRPWLDAASYDADAVAIAAAASAVLGDPARPNRVVTHVGSPRGRAAASLGRALAAVGGPAASPPPADSEDAPESAFETLEREVTAYAENAEADGHGAPGSGVVRALQLELDLEAGAGGRVARALGAWAVAGRPAERDRALAAALVAEQSGELERAIGDYDRARLLDPSHEGAARARSAHAEAGTAARVLAEHARALDPGTRAAVLLSESAIRLTQADAADEAGPLLRRAAELDPGLPFAFHLGERSARSQGDREALTVWLRARREGTDDPAEQAHDLVREALLVSDSDGSSAVSLLEQALRARPRDVGLRDLYERLSPEPPADRAAWRAERAAETSGPDAARLALEAALDFERAGDFERAAPLAARAVAEGDTLLAPLSAYRCAIAGYGAGELIDILLPRARETTDPVERFETYERLADLDELGRKDLASGLLWRRAILDDAPGHLPTLRRIATTLISGGRDDELEPIALEIAKALEGPESVAHAAVSARLRLRALGWDDTAEPVAIAYKSEPRGIWTLRQMAAHARAQNQHLLAVEADLQLLEQTERPAEIATLCMRAGESAARAGVPERARELFARACELLPDHLPAQLRLAQALEEGGEHAAAAEALEAAAASSLGPAEQIRHFHHAARLWIDPVKDLERGRQALERVAALDPNYADTFQRLQEIYVASGARAELAALLERRLDAVTDPKERVEMEVLRGRALAEVGDSAAAKRALAAALDANPDHVDALGAFAEISASEQDWQGAEGAWIRLARLVPDPARQSAIYFKLGELYDEHVPNPERAELAYQEILKRSPADEGARERLVGLYQRGGDAVRAIEQQTVLITAAESPEQKCKRTAELALIYEATGNLKKAEATLVQLRKTWPKDDVGLAALVRFYQRTGQPPAAQVLLDRAIADARRALGTGRFEPFLFSTVATVAELRGRPDAARIATATVAALEGEPAVMDAAGPSAGDPRLDDLLAPELLTPAFRELLRKSGPLLDTAVPFDLAAVRATPLPSQQSELAEEVRALAEAYGMPGVHVQVSAVLGSVCVPASSHPPTLVLGQALVASPSHEVRTFLIHRALKVLQTNTGAFSRTAPIDLWPLLAAYLKAFSPNWGPQGVDAAKLTDAYGRVSRAMPARLDPQVGLLAADVIGMIGNRASTLGTAVHGWGNRAGLLAIGDSNVALTAIAWAFGQVNAPPPSGKDRLTWIGRNAEARELIVFSVSDAFADARARLGLGDDA